MYFHKSDLLVVLLLGKLHVQICDLTVTVINKAQAVLPILHMEYLEKLSAWTNANQTNMWLIAFGSKTTGDWLHFLTFQKQSSQRMKKQKSAWNTICNWSKIPAWLAPTHDCPSYIIKGQQGNNWCSINRAQHEHKVTGLSGGNLENVRKKITCICWANITNTT